MSLLMNVIASREILLAVKNILKEPFEANSHICVISANWSISTVLDTINENKVDYVQGHTLFQK